MNSQLLFGGEVETPAEATRPAPDSMVLGIPHHDDESDLEPLAVFACLTVAMVRAFGRAAEVQMPGWESGPSVGDLYRAHPIVCFEADVATTYLRLRFGLGDFIDYLCFTA